MAKIRGPLLSQEARGKIAERLVFSLRSSGQQARFQIKQKDVITEFRTTQRAYYLAAVAAWNILSNLEKQEWRDLAFSKHYTGYNLFIKVYIDNIISAGGKATFGVAIYGNTLYGYS